MKCLKNNSYDNSQCRLQSKDYLECRMEQWEHWFLGEVLSCYVATIWFTTNTFFFCVEQSTDGQGTSGETGI